MRRELLRSAAGSSLLRYPEIVDYRLYSLVDQKEFVYGWIEISAPRNDFISYVTSISCEAYSFEDYLHVVFSNGAPFRILIISSKSDTHPGFINVEFLSDYDEYRIKEYVVEKIYAIRRTINKLKMFGLEPHGAELNTLNALIEKIEFALAWRVVAEPQFQMYENFCLHRTGGDKGHDSQLCSLSAIEGKVQEFLWTLKDEFLCDHDAKYDLSLPHQGIYSSGIAKLYDQSRALPEGVGKFVAGLIRTTQFNDLVELGAGTGRLSRSIVKASKDLTKVTLVDRSKPMLDQFRRMNMDCERLEWEVIHAGVDEFLEASPELNICIEHEAFFLHQNPGRLARTLASILSPGGLLVRVERVSEYPNPFNEFEHIFNKELAACAGLPRCFVGDNIDAILNDELRSNGVPTQTIEIGKYSRSVCLEQETENRRLRCFPYLETFSDQELDFAIERVREANLPRSLDVRESYIAHISRKSR